MLTHSLNRRPWSYIYWSSQITGRPKGEFGRPGIQLVILYVAHLTFDDINKTKSQQLHRDCATFCVN